MRELPGRFSPPFVGDALSLLKDPEGFLSMRSKELGPVFRFHFLGDDIACFSGAEAFKLFLDDRYFTRASASPPHVQEILDKTAVPFLEGDAFKRRKALLMQAFTPEAVTSYAPVCEKVMRRYLSTWTARGSFPWVPSLTSLGMTVASALFLGGDPDKDDAALEEGFEAAFAGFLTIPVNLPFTTYGKALRARDAMRARIKAALDAHKSGGSDDVMGRLLAAKTADGAQLSPEEVGIETFHFFGAYVPVIGGMSFLAALLGQNPDVKERLRAEIQAKCKDGPVTPAALRELPYLDRVCRESRRVQPILPITFFASVKAECSYEDIRIPAGIKAMGFIAGTLHDETTFASASKFDPDRWENATERQHHAWVPHGGGSHLMAHRCAGEELANLMMKMFAVLALRDYDWTLPAQDLAPTKGRLFATPSSGLDVRFTKR